MFFEMVVSYHILTRCYNPEDRDLRLKKYFMLGTSRTFICYMYIHLHMRFNMFVPYNMEAGHKFQFLGRVKCYV